MSVMHYCMEYRVHDYTLADAFRPDPKWGKRSFTVDADKVGAHVNDAELIKAAHETAPERYVLARLWEVGSGYEREIYVSPTPVNRAAFAKATESTP